MEDNIFELDRSSFSRRNDSFWHRMRRNGAVPLGQPVGKAVSFLIHPPYGVSLGVGEGLGAGVGASLGWINPGQPRLPPSTFKPVC